MFTKGKLDLRQFFARTEEVVSKLNINNLQLASSEIFEFISTKEFKDTCNNVLHKIIIAILKKVTIIRKTNAKAILQFTH